MIKQYDFFRLSNLICQIFGCVQILDKYRFLTAFFIFTLLFFVSGQFIKQEISEKDTSCNNLEEVGHVFNERILDFYEKNLGLCTEDNGGILIFYKRKGVPRKIDIFLKIESKIPAYLPVLNQLQVGPKQACSESEHEGLSL